MIGTRYEEYGYFDKGLPFVLNSDIKRTSFIYSKEKNWHEDIEIQLCTEGKGWVLLNGEKYEFCENDIAIVNSNVIHYTSTDSHITYTCLIVSASFCRQMGIDYEKLEFNPLIKSEKTASLIKKLNTEYLARISPCRTARLNEILLGILIELTENHSKKKSLSLTDRKTFETVKATIKYIRENYNRKLFLDEISKQVLTDKYTLCREFKKLAGQTVVEYTNNYRCQKAADYITDGYTVAEAAGMCGFENLSFFTKTFKKYMGALPSEYKNKN